MIPWQWLPALLLTGSMEPKENRESLELLRKDAQTMMNDGETPLPSAELSEPLRNDLPIKHVYMCMCKRLLTIVLKNHSILSAFWLLW